MSFTGAPLFAQQAYEWGLINHVVAAEELLDKASEMAANMCACVPEVLKQYKSLIDEGYNKSYREALAWEEQKAIESAREIMATTIAGRRDAIMEKGRSEKNDR